MAEEDCGHRVGQTATAMIGTDDKSQIPANQVSDFKRDILLPGGMLLLHPTVANLR